MPRRRHDPQLRGVRRDKLELRRAGRPLQADALSLAPLGRAGAAPGDLITKHEIVSTVCDDSAISDTALSVSMARLRKLLGQQRDKQLGPALSAPGLVRMGAPVSIGPIPALELAH